MMLVGLSFIIAQAFFVDWVLLFIIPPTILIADLGRTDTAHDRD